MSRTRLSLALMVLAVAWGRPVRAQVPPADGMDVQIFHPAVGRSGYVTVYGAEVPGHLNFGVGLLASYQRDPFVLHRSNGGDPLKGSVVPVVRNLVVGDLYGFIGLTRYLSIGLSMPLGLYMSGSLPDDQGNAEGDLKHFGWGDLAVHFQGVFHRFDRLHLVLAGVLSVTVPTGKYADNYLGEKMVTLIPRVVAEWTQGRFSVAANLGAVLRTEPVSFYDDTFTIGQQFLYGLAGGWFVHPLVRLMVELTGRSGFSSLDDSPMEVAVAARWSVYRGIGLCLGANAGVLAGIGTPLFRTYLGIRWTPIFTDSDDDGVPDDVDKCPGQLEDHDGYKDGDGCPDPDNDGDGIPDARDKCPNAVEDFDGYKDMDGCPDPDNDGDHICDANMTIQRSLGRFASQCSGKDNCPMNAGPAATHGCPKSMLDDDGDGVPDSLDRCPHQPEDKDGFQDQDGCPDPDNDGDGVCDPNAVIQGNLARYAKICKGKDVCPAMPEDRDGYKDADGCPDPDDDGDGVCDANSVIQAHLSAFTDRCIGADRCPGKKETINGNKDLDGCPDSGRSDLAIRGNQIATPRHRITFKGTSSVMGSGSDRILSQLAAFMRARRDIGRLVVVGYTDTFLPKDEALRVSQAYADAVRKALVARGIASNRLMAKGLGGARPIYSGRSRRKQRKLNRRVEFYVVPAGK
ncbi:MAG: OmpA family protein [Deltaproteobacteria bacterium]|nr:OmpA family protein [Deltaproteobacteria bacterium]